MGSFSYNLDTQSFLYFFNHYPLFLAIPLIIAIILLIILIIKFNLLKRRALIVLGIVSATLLIVSFQIGIYSLFIISYYQDFSILYLSALCAMMILLITFMASRKAEEMVISSNDKEKLHRSEIYKPRSLVRMIFIIISLMVVIQLFGPSSFGRNYEILYTYPATIFYPYIDIYFFLGLHCHYNYLNNELVVNFNPYSLFQTIPMIFALILLLILVVKYNVVKRRFKMIIGIISSTLILLSLVLLYSFLMYIAWPLNNFSLFLLGIHFNVFCSIIILLGTRQISKKTENI